MSCLQGYQVNEDARKPFVNAEGHLVVPIKFKFKDRTVKCLAMIDSGATSDFMDSDWARQWRIPCIQKPRPIPLRTIDGSPIVSGDVTHETKSLIMVLEGEKSSMNFDLTSLGGYHVILGLRWLSTHNPCIDWREGTVTWTLPETKRVTNTPPTGPSGVSGHASIWAVSMKELMEWEEEEPVFAYRFCPNEGSDADMHNTKSLALRATTVDDARRREEQL